MEETTNISVCLCFLWDAHFTFNPDDDGSEEFLSFSIETIVNKKI
jgi:hypothetical protein